MKQSITLPSGAKLEITVSPFPVAKALYQAFLEEAKGISISGKNEVAGVIKDILCIGFSSRKIESCLEKCMERATYNGHKLIADTFEPLEARLDYIDVCLAVAQANLDPFMKGLYAQFVAILEKVEKNPA